MDQGTLTSLFELSGLENLSIHADDEFRRGSKQGLLG